MVDRGRKKRGNDETRRRDFKGEKKRGGKTSYVFSLYFYSATGRKK